MEKKHGIDQKLGSTQRKNTLQNDQMKIKEKPFLIFNWSKQQFVQRMIAKMYSAV